MENDLEKWIGDKIVKLTGISESTVVLYIGASAKKAKSASKLLEMLHINCDMPKTMQVQEFCTELYNKIPRPKSDKRARNEKLRLLSSNQKFKMVELDQREENQEENGGKREKNQENGGKREKNQENGGKREKKEEKREPKEDKRRLSSVSPMRKEKKIRSKDYRQKAQQWDILDATDDEFSEQEIIEQEDLREKDLRERNEFENRLKEKDLEVKLDHKFDQESILRRRMAKDEQTKKELIPKMRERSRYEYLKEREKKELALLQKEVEDEELLFNKDQLTKKEIKKLQMKKTLLGLTKDRENIQTTHEGYIIPEDNINEKGKIKQESVLYKRYEEKGSKPISDMQQWEDAQVILINKIQKNLYHKQKQEDEFDYVFDESQHIDFIKQQSSNQQIVELIPKVKEADQKAATMKEVRESLPIFVYRDQLLEAIDQFQTLIIVGETGEI
jgi:pre-mRNA-splicing factor ATP-dependent RNA helicase DHX16